MVEFISYVEFLNSTKKHFLEVKKHGL